MLLGGGAAFLAVIAFLIGSAIPFSDTPLLELCRKECWLNSLLYAVLGESGGKLGLAAFWYGTAMFCGVVSFRVLRKK
jgi:hypothetical protein